MRHLRGRSGVYNCAYNFVDRPCFAAGFSSDSRWRARSKPMANRWSGWCSAVWLVLCCVAGALLCGWCSAVCLVFPETHFWTPCVAGALLCGWCPAVWCTIHTGIWPFFRLVHCSATSPRLLDASAEEWMDITVAPDGYPGQADQRPAKRSRAH